MPLLRSRRRPRGVVTGLAALAVGALLLWHGLLPDTGGAASLLESFLPWLGVLLALLGLAALLRLSLIAGVCVALAAAAWWSQFGEAALPAPTAGAPAVTVVSENIRAANPQAGAIAADLAARRPDVIVLEEVDEPSRDAVAPALAARYPYAEVVGTVGVWSRYPLSGPEGLDLGLGWARALRVDIATPGKATRLYAVHAASVRPGEHDQRDEMLGALARAVAADRSARLVVAGDLNTASTDRTLAPLLRELHEDPDTALGLGFTWPSAFPLARLDHVLTRGFATVSSAVLPANGSDHRGIEVGLR